VRAFIPVITLSVLPYTLCRDELSREGKIVLKGKLDAGEAQQTNAPQSTDLAGHSIMDWSNNIIGR
jgi:hypothetical protein